MEGAAGAFLRKSYLDGWQPQEVKVSSSVLKILISSRPFRLISGVALLTALLLLAHPGRFLAALRGGEPLPVAVAVVPFTAVLLLEAWRIALLFRPYDLDYATAFRMTLASMFFGTFTPGNLGGEAYKVYFAHNRVPGLARPMALTVLLRLTGFGATLALVALYCAAYPERLLGARERGLLQAHWSGPSPGILAIAALLLAAGAGFGLARSWGGVLRQRARAALANAGQALHQIRPVRMAGLVLISLLIAAMRVLYLYLLACSFTKDLFLPDLAPVAAASLLAGAVPVTIGGLGTQEGALAAGLVLFGVPYPEAVAVSLLNRGFLWAAAAAGWAALSDSRPGARGPAV